MTRAAENTARLHGRAFKIGDHVSRARKIRRIDNPHFWIGFAEWNIAQAALCVFIEHARIDSGLP